jgi:tellurite resistance protein
VSDPRVPVERAFQVTDPLSAAEQMAILEVAFLVTAADREMNREERQAIEQVAARLCEGSSEQPVGGAELDALLDRFSDQREREGQQARLEAIAAALPRPTMRALAYRVACAMAISDLDLHDREFELDLSLIDALGLPQATADELSADVHLALARSS